MERKIVSNHQGGFSTRQGPRPHSFNPSKLPEVFLRPDIDERRARLAEVIAEKIVPRLQLIHHDVSRAGSPPIFAPSEIADFGALAIGRDAAAAMVYFERLRAKGHQLEALFEHLLAPTARHLGELWDQDLCDFVDVTLGVARLQELLAMFGSDAEAPVVDARHRALLISIPEEQHVFGVDMVAKFMRGAGWDVIVEKGLGLGHNAAVVATEWFAVAGVTLSADAGIEVVAKIVDVIRHGSMNRAIGIMVGGPAFTRNPELVARVGADAAAADGPTAVILAKKLLMCQPKAA